jgi:outer membrane protein OmpA-like peptidoglycan-associated protein
MKKILFVVVFALCLGACLQVKSDPGRVGQMYFTTISFTSSGQEISRKSYKFLDQAAKIYKKNPTVQVQVRGYTDSTGSEAGNLTLSQERAETVSVALQERGIPKENISAVGYGPAKPLASNQTPEGRQQNRRVEIEFPYPEN